ncbi:MAG TPA: PEP-CTERM sorting domain-containing protein [Tepidisphaeraceae bacterium]
MGSVASAASYAHFDINDVTASLSAPLSTSNASTYTGTITLATNGLTHLDGIDIDGADQGAVGTVTNVTGTLDMVNGTIGGSSSLTFTIENSDNSLHTFTGTVDDLNSDGTYVYADANPSSLDSSNFAGVDLSQWASHNNDSQIIVFGFPSAGGSTNTASLEVYVPEPASLGLMGIAGLALVRRRGR